MVRMQDLPLDLATLRASRVSDYRRGGEQFVNAVRIVGRDRAAHAVGAHIYSAHGVEWIVLERAAAGAAPVFECLWFHDGCERSGTLAGAEERLYRHIAKCDAQLSDAPLSDEQLSGDRLSGVQAA